MPPCEPASAATGSGPWNDVGVFKHMMKALLSALLILAAGPALAQSQQTIEIAQLPYMEIFSPTFFWSDEADAIRTGSTTCPKGRAITGGLNIIQGKASLRIVESYPDGESWVVEEPMPLSHAPVWHGGRLESRAVMLRVFAVGRTITRTCAPVATS